jgi:hypothetical protein
MLFSRILDETGLLGKRPGSLALLELGRLKYNFSGEGSIRFVHGYAGASAEILVKTRSSVAVLQFCLDGMLGASRHRAHRRQLQSLNQSTVTHSITQSVTH